MFENALWESRCHGKPTFLNACLFIALALFIAVPFTIHFLGFGAVAITLLVLAVAILVAVLVVARKARWYNAKLIFALTDEGVYFTSVPDSSSYFFEEYENMAGYSCVGAGEFTTVTVHFKQRSDAGMYGKILALKMVKIENVVAMKEVMAAHGIEEIAPPKK